MTSLFAHGVSEGEVGTSPADAEARADGDTDHGTTDGEDPADGTGASDGGADELAETGVEVTGPAALAALMLTGGAGLLWHQRRREN